MTTRRRGTTDRIGGLDWLAVGEAMDVVGIADAGKVLLADQCRSVRGL